MSASSAQHAPRILFVCDAGPDVGGGHVMRSLTLAHALQEAGAECAFLVRPAVEAVLDAFAPETIRVSATEPFNAMVFDHYGLAAPDHRALAKGRPTLVIDDLANRPLEADLVLDAGPARQPEDYAGLTPPHAVLLLGPHHAPVRPVFSALRDQALVRREAGAPVRRILISLGLTDVGGVTSRVVDLLLPRIGGIALDVVLGGGAPSLERLRGLSDPRVTLHVDTQDMPRLTLNADLAVGAGGSTSWERCILALPTLTLILAANQLAAATALEAVGASPCLDVAEPGFDQAFGSEIDRLLGDPSLRASLSAASAQVCDGGGAQRVAAAFLDMIPRPEG